MSSIIFIFSFILMDWKTLKIIIFALLVLYIYKKRCKDNKKNTLVPVKPIEVVDPIDKYQNDSMKYASIASFHFDIEPSEIKYGEPSIKPQVPFASNDQIETKDVVSLKISDEDQKSNNTPITENVQMMKINNINLDYAPKDIKVDKIDNEKLVESIIKEIEDKKPIVIKKIKNVIKTQNKKLKDELTNNPNSIDLNPKVKNNMQNTLNECDKPMRIADVYNSQLIDFKKINVPLPKNKDSLKIYSQGFYNFNQNEEQIDNGINDFDYGLNNFASI